MTEPTTGRRERKKAATRRAIAEATGGDPADIAVTGLVRFVLETVALARNADDLDTLFAFLKTGRGDLGT